MSIEMATYKKEEKESIWYLTLTNKKYLPRDKASGTTCNVNKQCRWSCPAGAIASNASGANSGPFDLAQLSHATLIEDNISSRESGLLLEVTCKKHTAKVIGLTFNI